MRTYWTYALAVVTAALAAAAIAGWQNNAEAPKPKASAEQSSRAGSVAAPSQAVYLPNQFVEEMRAAKIEPLPPQF